MILPVELRPTKSVAVRLPSGTSATLPVAYPSFQSWTGKKVFDFGRKPLLDYDGEVCFAELLILRLLFKSGWSGVWVEAYGGGRHVYYLQSMPASWTLAPHHIPIPYDKHALLRQIARVADTPSCFDVFVWSGEQILFCEAKYVNPPNKDRLRETQLKFIEGALACGIPPQALLLVEWSKLVPATPGGSFR